MIRYFFFLLFVLIMPEKGFSQSLTDYEVYRPSVNSEQFNIGASIETALSKGQPSISIPLFELQGKGYNLPVSLMFYGGDVTCETEASSIGLGWSLMAGGCITTTVRDKEDTLITTFNDAPWQFQSNYLDSMYQIPTKRDVFVDRMISDLMPDETQYTIPGHHGSVEFVQNSQYQYCPKLFPDETYKFDTTANGYVITADDGTRFIFEDLEWNDRYNQTSPATSAWFLTRIETVRGGTFLFNYADETVMDLHDEFDHNYYGCHHTKRITSIISDFGSISFTSAGGRIDKNTRDIIGRPLASPSERITKIELKDESGAVVKGYELASNGYFTNEIQDQRGNMDWCNYRLRLDSIVPYDGSGNKLPPYVFAYSYRFHRARSCYNQYYNGYENSKRGSWTETPTFQVFVNLHTSGLPACMMINGNTPYEYVAGFSFCSDNYDGTVNDYFCLDSVRYPTGALDAFEYESHNYSNIAGTDIDPFVNLKIEGKRLKRMVSDDGTGNLQARTITEYIYRKHDSNYDLAGGSSGVLTNPAFHNATRYTWGMLTNNEMGYVANRITSDRPFNSHQGQPVYYREVEEVVKNCNDSIKKRIIHYFRDNLLTPPENYIYVRYHTGVNMDHFLALPNIIYGKRTGYDWLLNDYNNQNFAYLAYPLGEFCQQSQDGGRPCKEILIDGNGRLVMKKEYQYGSSIYSTRYGYVYTKDDFTEENAYSPYMTVYNISKSSYHTCRSHVIRISETAYSYRNGIRDSIVTETSYGYNLGRLSGILTERQADKIQVLNYYPDFLSLDMGAELTADAQAVAVLQQNNIIGKPLQTTKFYNGIPIEGTYSEYMVLSNGIAVPKAAYGLSLNSSHVSGPFVANGAIVKNSGFYLKEEVMTYDINIKPSHVCSRISPDKVLVWGYGGRYPIAVFENYTWQELNANNQLRYLLYQLGCITRIGPETSSLLKSLNMNIRNSLPDGVLVTTYTYAPYAGITSEFDHSGVGTIFTYDGFGRLTALYDDSFNLIENYTYHYAN